MLYSVSQKDMEQLSRHVSVGLYLAQLVELFPVKEIVGGSNPPILIKNAKTDSIHFESGLIPCTSVNMDILGPAKLMNVEGMEHGDPQVFIARKADGILNFE